MSVQTCSRCEGTGRMNNDGKHEPKSPLRWHSMVCSRCGGSGVIMRGASDPDCDPRHPCSRCDGSGVELMVPVAEVLAFLDDLPDSGDLSLALHLIEIRTLLSERFGGGER